MLNTNGHRIHFIMGKGGVGKTTVSIQYAQYLAAQKNKVLVIECNGCTDLKDHVNCTIYPEYQIVQIAPYLDIISISPLKAIEDYAIQQLKARKLFEIIFKNHLVEPLIESAPGLHDAVQLGKIYDLAIHKTTGSHLTYDHIIVDAPATGHGLLLLNAAQTMMNISKKGPLYNQNELVESKIKEWADVLLVTLPEELPCLETKELFLKIRPDFQKRIKGIVLNKWMHLPNHLQRISNTDREILDHHPMHLQQLNQWLEQVQTQEYWMQWLQKEFAIPILKCPLSWTESQNLPWQNLDWTPQ